MTLGEKLEQRLTGRPNSYVPAHTLAHLLHKAVYALATGVISDALVSPARSSSAARP